MQRTTTLPGIFVSCLCALSMVVASGCSALAALDEATSVSANAGQGRTDQVSTLRTPEGGIQPQAVLDASGTLHLIYFKGKPMAGDIFYVRRDAGATAFSAPLRVNSGANSAIAMGWIRGAQLAVGKNGRVHVAWNGSNEAEKGPGGNPMLYTRLNDEGTAFEPQRNLITWAGGIDGGGTLAADNAGSVYVFWHALAGAKDESGRAVFLARSTDAGKTFARESQVNPEPTGACGCCGMKAMIAADGSLHVLYRAARNNMDRDTILLVSHDKGAKFQSQTLDKWQLMACPLTTYSISQAAPGTPVFGPSMCACCKCCLCIHHLTPFLLQESRQCALHFCEQFFFGHRLRAVMLTARTVAEYAPFQMLGQQFDAQRIQCGAHGGNLVQNVHAVAIFLHHALDACHLPRDAVNPRPHLLTRFVIHYSLR